MEHKFMHERPLLEVVHQDLPEVDWLKETFQEIRNVQFKFEDDPAFEGGAFYLPESDLHPPRIVIAAGGVRTFCATQALQRRWCPGSGITARHPIRTNRW